MIRSLIYYFTCLLFGIFSYVNVHSKERIDTTATIIPFNRAGNLIIIKAKADSIEGNFILDTGAPGLVLNLTYFRHYQLTAADDRGSVTGLIGTAQETIINSFSFGEESYVRQHADLVNLGHIEDRKNIKIIGLIGVSFFKQSELIIDYEKSLIYMWPVITKKTNTYRNPMLTDTNSYSIVPIEIVENKIVAYTKLAGRKLKFIIDTGAEANVLDTRLPNKIFENVTISRRTSITGTGNRKIEALYGNIKNMKIGNIELGALPIVVTNLENACITNMCCVDGMLGFDFLSLHKIGFNFVKREMYIWK
ncbi:MAG: pepsin/retropepsin-like aspartic protease family protein [Bacteroidota bacterium]